MQNRRNRHRNNRNGGHQRRGNNQNIRSKVFDSNGPDVRIRGTAFQIVEKYQALAKDAAASGDRVLSESYLQHAEHYQRMINEFMAEFEQYAPQQAQTGQDDEEVVEDQPSVSFLMQPGQQQGEQPAMAEA